MNIDTDLVKKYHNTHSKDSNIIKYACEYRVLATLRYFYPKEYEIDFDQKNICCARQKEKSELFEI